MFFPIKNVWLFLLVCGIQISLSAQQDTCNCLLNLNYMAAKISANYAGYADKVNDATKTTHTHLLDSLAIQAKPTTHIRDCYQILEKYRQFFYDKHLQLKMKPPAATANNGGNTGKPTEQKRAQEVVWKRLPGGTLYIKLKSCKLYNKPVLDSLIRVHRQELDTIADWIIDFRGNTGGSTDVFKELLPYLYTKPYVSWGDNHLLTQDAAERLSSFLDKNEKQLDAVTTTRINNWIHFAQKKPGQWYTGSKDTLSFDKIYEFPKRVAVLSDKENGSSGETFLIVAKGLSDKVTVFGENSGGYLDYGDLLPYPLPCKAFSLSIPSRRANYLDHGVSYDKKGFPPDVYISPKNTNWITFVQNYWRIRTVAP